MAGIPWYRTSRNTKGGSHIVVSDGPPASNRALLDWALASGWLHAARSPASCCKINVLHSCY